MVIAAVMLWCGTAAEAQNGFSVFSMGGLVPQNSNLNPAFAQQGKLVIGLPVVSELGLHVNNRFSYRQAFTDLENDSVRLDVDKLVGNLKKKNVLLTEVRVPVLYVGLQPEASGVGYSFFVNDRLNAGVQYQKAFFEAVWNGTQSLIGNPISLRKSALSATYFREYGLGAQMALPNDAFRLGVRLKLIQGIFAAKTLAGLEASLDVDPVNYGYGFSMSNAGVNTAGTNRISDTGYLIWNKNKGMALDVGATWEYNNLLSFSAAINDLGFVRWKDDPANFVIRDTSFVFNGIDFRVGSGIEATIDSLVSAITPQKSTSPYTAMLNTRVVLGGSLLLGPADRVSVAMISQFLVGKMKTGFSAAYVKQLTPGITASGTLVRLPQQWPLPGAAVVFGGGPVQYYLASDNLVGFINLPGMKALDLKMGINIMPGQKKPKNEEHLPPAHRSKPRFSSKGRGLDYPTDPRLRKPKIFRKSGIYQIIPKRKQPKSWKHFLNGKSREN